MLTSNPESLALAIEAVQFPNVPNQQALHLAKRQRRQQLSSVQIMLDFPEDPGSPLSSAAYHQGVGPGVVEHCSGFMRVSNIPIRDNRNGNTLLNCPNAVVFRVAVKQTGAGSAVNRQGLNTTVFGQLGNLHSYDALAPSRCESSALPAHPPRQPPRGGSVLPDPGTATRRTRQASGSLFGRASHIDVDDLRAAGHVDTRGGGHIIRIASGNLHGADPGSSLCTIRRRDLSVRHTSGLEESISDTAIPAPIA